MLLLAIHKGGTLILLSLVDDEKLNVCLLTIGLIFTNQKLKIIFICLGFSNFRLCHVDNAQKTKTLFHCCLL